MKSDAKRVNTITTSTNASIVDYTTLLASTNQAENILHELLEKR